MKTCKSLIVFCILLSILCLAGTAFAQTPDEITGMKLKDISLTLQAGETYRFEPQITTNTVSGAYNIALNLFSSNENVVRVTDELNTVEAVGGGKAEIYVFTAGYEFSAVCTVNVTGQAKSLVSKGEPWNNLTTAELAKVNDPSMKAFFGMLSKPSMSNAASAAAQKTTFGALVKVAPGEAQAIGDLMQEIGMDQIQ